MKNMMALMFGVAFAFMLCVGCVYGVHCSRVAHLEDRREQRRMDAVASFDASVRALREDAGMDPDAGRPVAIYMNRIFEEGN